MGDDSRKSLVNTLKNEWALLWESLGAEDAEHPETENAFETGRVRSLTLDDVRRLTREMSNGRRRLNRRLESLHKEIELNSAKLESLRVVGGEDDETVRKIHELTEQGQQVTHELDELNRKLRLAREHEDRLKRRPTTPA